MMEVSGMEAAMMIERSVDTVVFNAYCEQVLRPTLKPGEVIVLDNLEAHRASRIEEIAKSYGAASFGCRHIHPTFHPLN